MPATRRTLTSSARRGLAALIALVGLGPVACKDIYAPRADAPTVEGKLAVTPFTGSKVNEESGLFITALQATEVRETGYDAVLDLTTDGRVVIYPASYITRCSGCVLGIAPSSVPFDQMYIAPEQKGSTYRYNTPDTVSVGEPVYLVTKYNYCNPTNVATVDVYAKLVVDSVKSAERKIFVHGVVDPNCGFRELKPGEVPRR